MKSISVVFCHSVPVCMTVLIGTGTATTAPVSHTVKRLWPFTVELIDQRQPSASPTSSSGILSTSNTSLSVYI
ncbi:hypothetical protein BGX38DRAFT_1226647 [Terfezia claveryi]|nr:hypothetical protein BGX38DRAFT_1226647 [Terfezia claveryi]